MGRTSPGRLLPVQYWIGLLQVYSLNLENFIETIWGANAAYWLVGFYLLTTQLYIYDNNLYRILHNEANVTIITFIEKSGASVLSNPRRILAHYRRSNIRCGRSFWVELRQLPATFIPQARNERIRRQLWNFFCIYSRPEIWFQELLFFPNM